MGRKKVTEGSISLIGSNVIILAAGDLILQDPKFEIEFSEWDLSEAAWKRDKYRFGYRGKEEIYPDHKKAIGALTGNSSSPIDGGYLTRTRTNYYRLTDLGKEELARLRSLVGDRESESKQSPGVIYMALKPYVFSRPFTDWCQDPEEPRTWTGASLFFRLGSNDPKELKTKTKRVLSAIRHAKKWLKDQERSEMTPGPYGGGKEIHLEDINKLQEFIGILETRFKHQIDAIKGRSGVQHE